MMLPPGGYIVHASFGIAQALKKVQLRAETVREVFDIPAGGIRIEGKVGDARIPPGQIHFDIFKGSQFEAGDKRALTQNVMTGEVMLVPEGTYHIVSHYGDGNAVVRSDIRVQAGTRHRRDRDAPRRRRSRSSWSRAAAARRSPTRNGRC